MAQLSDETKSTTGGLLNFLSSKLGFGASSVSDKTTNSELLGYIYELMVKTDMVKKRNEQLRNNMFESSELKAEQEHKELLSVLPSSSKAMPKQETEITDVKAKKPKPTKIPKVKVPKVKKPKLDKIKPAKGFDKPSVFSPKIPKVTTATKTTNAGISGAARTAGVAAVGLGAVFSAAAVSVFGETGAKNRSEAVKKSGQVVGNDPEPGQYSYGVFGMNTKSKTIDGFVASHPEFGLKSKPGTSAFNEEWKNLGATRSEELYNAQMEWYQTNVLQPLKQDMKNLPVKFANDQRILTYLADRRIQYGTVQEKTALQYASSANTGEEFIQRMTEYDMNNIGTAFKTALSNRPEIEQGLRNRIQNRQNFSLEMPTDGSKLYSTSSENQSLNEQNAVEQSSQIINNTTVVNKSGENKQSSPEVDDRPAYERKSNSK